MREQLLIMKSLKKIKKIKKIKARKKEKERKEKTGFIQANSSTGLRRFLLD